MEFGLSSSQSRILLAELDHSGTLAYHLYFKMQFDAEDLPWLEKAASAVICGNYNLRVRSGEGGYVQYYSEEPAQIEKFDYRGRDQQAVCDKLQELRQVAIAPLFDAPLYRLYLFETDGPAILFFVFHHLISDGTTLSHVLPRQLKACVEALKAGKTWKAPASTYDEYLRRVNAYLETPESEADRQYWLSNLTGFTGAGYKAKTLSKGTLDYCVPKDLTEKLLILGNEARISPFVLAMGSVFAYYQGLRTKLDPKSRDMVWDISVNGRYFGDDIAGEPGMFVETLPLRIYYDENQTFTELLSNCKSVMKAGLSHAKTSCNLYFPELQKRGTDLRALTSFSIVDNSCIETLSEYDVGLETDVPFHVRVNLNRDNSMGLQTLRFEYNSDIFTESDVAQVWDGVLRVLNQAAGNPEMRVGDMELTPSRLITAECYVAENLAVAAEPTALQCGAVRNASGIGEVHTAIRPDHVRLTAALMALLSRFGLSRELLIGVKPREEVLPFGLKIDTSQPAKDFAAAICNKLAVLREIDTYKLSCRTDVDFKPSILLSFGGNKAETDAEITLFAVEDSLDIRYDAGRYSRNYINAFVKALEVIYKTMDTDTPLRDIPLVKRGGIHHEIILKNEGTINAILERMAGENPDKTILIARDCSMTFSELDRASNRIGHALIDRGIRPHDRVLLLMRRTSALVACVFGVLKAGAAFIPMDPEYPKDRIEQILTDSEAALIITDVPQVAEGFIEKCVSPAELVHEDSTRPCVTVTPEDMCFIIYTSGTTGRPKGVVLSHRGISNYIAPEPENAPIYALARHCSSMLCLSSVSFIVFLREIFGTILNGVRVVLCDEEQMVNPMTIAELVSKYHIDALGATPTRLLQYSEIPAFCVGLRGVRVMIVGGEGFPGRLFRIIREYSDCAIYNSYGPTEVTIASHQKRMDSERVSAGFTMLNVWDRICDPNGGELPNYAVGELYVGGAGVAMGYFHNDELTAERFPTIDGERYCNTGDLAYRDDSGEVFVLGRNDGMIKLRGLRIELEEIENTLGRYPGVTQARVIVKTVQGTEHLCAFYTVKADAVDVTADRLRDFVLEKLPPYMAPTYYTRLAAFPMTPNGKVAMKRLRELEIDTQARAVLERPKTKIQKAVFDMTASLLENTQFGIKDDLFSLGLTSLSMIALVSDLYEKFDLPVKVTELIKRRTVAGIAALIDEMTPEKGENREVRHEVSAYPMTSNQLGIYFDCMAHPDSVGYHLPNVIRFDSSVDPEKLRDAVIKTVNHHPYLKVIFGSEGGKPVQLRDDAREFDVPVKHVSEFTDEMAEKLAAEPFDLNGSLLFRFRIFVTDSGTCLFSLFHHLIVDGGSLNLVFSDIAAAYNGQPMSVEKCDGYKLSEMENEAEESSALAYDEEFYKSQFAIVDEATTLTANLKGDEAEGRLGTVDEAIDTKIVDALCRRYHVSQNVVFMSAMAVVLTKFNSDDKLLLATVSNGRLNPMVKNTVALLIKTLPLALKPDRTLTIPALFEYAGETWMNTLSHQTLPFAKLSGDYDFHPDFFYTYHGKIYDEIELGGRRWPRGRISYDSLRYKVMLNIVQEEAYHIRAEFNDALYSEDYMQTFVRCMANVIRDWSLSNSLEDTRICDISLGDENVHYDFHPLKEVMVHRTIERMAAEQPDLPIVTCHGETLTYDQLNRRANRIAHALRKRGVQDGGRVVLLMPRTVNLIASMLGVLKAGAGYIPMDVEYPEERVNYVVQDSDADFIITDLDLPRHVSVDELLLETDETNPPATTDPDRVSYMIYTSGSTGRPKGVELTHRGLSNVCLPLPENNYYHTRPDKPASVLETATVSFDISVLDIINCLMNGMRLIFADDVENRDISQMIALIRKEKPEAIGMMTPSRLLQYMSVPEFAEATANARMCSVGGEPFLPALLEKIRQYSDMDIYNAYGPSEITIISNTRIVREEPITSVGNALYNVQCEIRDMDGRMLPDGVVGEMYIGGYGVGLGYHNLPEKTAAGFVRINNVPYFRSGDYCYRLPDGNFMVLGRRDGQIKLRGLRIEIGEIEQSMLAYPSVKEAAVIIRKINNVEHLCGYFSSGEDIDPDDFRSFLASRLTPYMVPTVLMRLEQMPYTPNGKLDRRNLPDPEVKRDYAAPLNDVEAFFCNVFEEALGIDRVGATDDYFEIGGTSLLAIQVTILASNGGYDIKFRDVFEHPTPRQLAEFVSGDKAVSGEIDAISNYDYTAIHERLRENTLENYLSGEHRSMRRVLLTGATGFLGVHVLRELLEHTDAVVYCVVRSGKLSAAERLMGRLFYYFDTDYAYFMGTRLMITEGEITDAESLKKMDDLGIDTVLNCAASVKHFSAGSDIYDTNVLGLQNVLEYAERVGAGLVHISTTSTGGEILLDGRHERFVYDEQTLFRGQVLDNQYLSSNFLAERLVLTAAAEGADAKVIRVGNLMARDKDGIFQINFRTNGFINRLKAFVTLHALPLNKMLQKLEMSPIDLTAEAIVKLAQTPKACCLFNCYNCHTINYGDLQKATCDIGIDIQPVSQETFDRLLDEAKHDSEMQAGIGGLISTVGMGTSSQRALTPVSNDYTTAVLFNEGVYWPLITEEYLSSFFKYLTGLAFWEDV